jgi:hypothetical protein
MKPVMMTMDLAGLVKGAPGKVIGIVGYGEKLERNPGLASALSPFIPLCDFHFKYGSFFPSDIFRRSVMEIPRLIDPPHTGGDDAQLQGTLVGPQQHHLRKAARTMMPQKPQLSLRLFNPDSYQDTGTGEWFPITRVGGGKRGRGAFSLSREHALERAWFEISRPRGEGKILFTCRDPC